MSHSPRSWAALATRRLTWGTSGPHLRSRDWGLLVRVEPGVSVCMCLCLWSELTGWKTAEWRWNMTKLLVLLSLMIPGKWLHYVLIQLLLKCYEVTREGMPKVLVCFSEAPPLTVVLLTNMALLFLFKKQKNKKWNNFCSFKSSLSVSFFRIIWGQGYDCVFSALLCFVLFFNPSSFSTICPLKQDYATLV